MHRFTGIPRNQLWNSRKGRSVASGDDLDWSMVGGLAGAFLLVAAAMVLSGRLGEFFDMSSVLIVVGGTVGATVAHHSWDDMRDAWRMGLGLLRRRPNRDLLRLSKSVRADGTLVLDDEAQRTRDTFFRLGLELAVDGQQADEIRHILSTELFTSQEQAERSIRVFETMGSYAPALGLIGTLIGLIQMLGRLGDPASVGPAMAVALVTTFYGALSANLIFLPIAGKLRLRHREDSFLKAVTIEGVVSLAKQENLVLLEQRLQGFMAPHIEMRRARAG